MRTPERPVHPGSTSGLIAAVHRTDYPAMEANVDAAPQNDPFPERCNVCTRVLNIEGAFVAYMRTTWDKSVPSLIVRTHVECADEFQSSYVWRLFPQTQRMNADQRRHHITAATNLEFLRHLRTLQNDEAFGVKSVAEALGISESLVSMRMTALERAGLIRFYKRGKRRDGVEVMSDATTPDELTTRKVDIILAERARSAAASRPDLTPEPYEAPAVVLDRELRPGDPSPLTLQSASTRH